MPGPLADLAAQVRETNEANGWYEVDRSFGDDIALLHSEVSEAFEEYRDGQHPAVTRYYLDLNEGSVAAERFGLPTSEEEAQALGRQIREEAPELLKPLGIPSELADVLIRLVDTADRYGVDLDAAVAEKIRFNRTRGHRHGGKVV